MNTSSYLHTVKLLRDLRGVFDLEECAEVPGAVVQLDLKPFVSERHLTAGTQRKGSETTPPPHRHRGSYATGIVYSRFIKT